MRDIGTGTKTAKEDRETELQRDSQTERQRDRSTEKQGDRETVKRLEKILAPEDVATAKRKSGGSSFGGKW